MLGRNAVMVTLDARAASGLPERFANDLALTLQFGWNVTPPMPDLTLGRHTLSATLAFGGVPFQVVIPWKAIHQASVVEEGCVVAWPRDFPNPHVTPERVMPEPETARERAAAKGWEVLDGGNETDAWADIPPSCYAAFALGT